MIDEATAFCPALSSNSTQPLLWTGADAPLVATDPPYYDNIGYADLSDFFYVWLRRLARRKSTRALQHLPRPKARTDCDSPYRFDGSKDAAQRFFEDGLGKAFDRTGCARIPASPLLLLCIQAGRSRSKREDENDVRTRLHRLGNYAGGPAPCAASDVRDVADAN